MTRESFDRALRLFQRQRPWKPFTLELISGSFIEVNHPESLTRSGDLLMCQSSSGVRTVFEYTSVIRFIAATGTT
jgi:hypothetical protein